MDLREVKRRKLKLPRMWITSIIYPRLFIILNNPYV